MKREYQIITNGDKFRIKSRLWIFNKPLWWKTEQQMVDSIDMAVMYEPVEFRTIADAEAWIDSRKPERWVKVGRFSHTNAWLPHEPDPNDTQKGPPA